MRHETEMYLMKCKTIQLMDRGLAAGQMAVTLKATPPQNVNPGNARIAPANPTQKRLTLNLEEMVFQIGRCGGDPDIITNE